MEETEGRDGPPYESWAFFLREHWSDAGEVAKYLRLPPGIRAEDREAVLRYVRDEDVLTDRWGNVAIWDQDWFDEQ